MGGPEFVGCRSRCIGFVPFPPSPTFRLILLCLSGIIPWNDPTPSDIKDAATALSKQLVPSLTSFALNPDVTFETHTWQRVHFGIWSVYDQILVVVVNLNPQPRNIPFIQLPMWKEGMEIDTLYGIDARLELEQGELIFENLEAVGLSYQYS